MAGSWLGPSWYISPPCRDLGSKVNTIPQAGVVGPGRRFQPSLGIWAPDSTQPQMAVGSTPITLPPQFSLGLQGFQRHKKYYPWKPKIH